MSASPSGNAVASSKRPLDGESSPTGPNDQPDAKRPALDKSVKADEADSPPVTDESAPVLEAPLAVKTELDNSLSNGHTDANGDTVVPDAPNGATVPVPVVQETQPIQSTAEQHDRSSRGSGTQHQSHQDETGWIHVRAVISSAEAATAIGKGGENVSQIRRLSGAKCTVSDYSRGAVERILTVSGLGDAVAKVRNPTSTTLITNCLGFRFDHSDSQ